MNRDHLLDTGVSTIVDDFRSAIAFLTRLPAAVVGTDPAVPPDFTRAARVFPAVGAMIGAAGGAVLVAATLLGMPPAVAATLAVATTVLITGGLHEDGLADTADAFGGGSVERRLAIMDDSRIGAYGVLALLLTVLAKVAAVAAIAGGGAFAAAGVLVAGEAVSRAAMVAEWHALPAAKPGGLAAETGPPSRRAMRSAVATAAVIALIAGGPGVGLVPCVLAGVLAAIASYIAAAATTRAIGGRTGDTLGACQQVAAAGFLVGASAVV